MKCVRGLSGAALVSFLSIHSGVAMSKVPEQVPKQVPNATSPAQTQPMIIANPFKVIQDAVRTVDTINQIRLREQHRQEAERRRQELEAARREATEQQRLEAEQRRQYFESLSPEEKEAYLTEQRARRAQQADKTAALLLLMLGAFSGGSGSTQQDNGRYVTCSDTSGDYQVYVRAGESLPDSTCQ